MCSNLLPLVLVEYYRCEEEDGMAEEPQEASLQGSQERPCDLLMKCQQILIHLDRIFVCCVVYLGEAEIEVSLQGTPLSGDDLVEH